MTAVEELQDTTSGFGWPVSLKVYRRGEHVFFEVQAVVELLGVEKQVRKHGFKFIDKFLRENGQYVFVVKPILLPTSGLRPGLCHHVYCVSSTHNTCLLSWDSGDIFCPFNLGF